MSRKTPPIGISGSFILRAPFTVDASQTYSVAALRSFDELAARKQDPLKLIYEPVGLTASAHLADVQANALVVCLRDRSGAMIYVPDTYVESFPSMGSIDYSRLVIGVSMGMWPDYRDISDIKNAIIESVRSKVGTTPELFVSRSMITNHVSEQEHAQITQARFNAVTNRETATATITRLSDLLQAREATIVENNQIIESLVNEITLLNDRISQLSQEIES